MRMVESKKRIDPIMGILIQDDLLQVQKRALALQEKRIPTGESKFQTFVVYAGERLTHIDFVRGMSHTTISRGRVIDVPFRPLYSLIVNNAGTGNLYVKTPLTEDNLEADNLIISGDNLPFTPGAPVIEMVNLVATGGDCTVRLYMTW